jgi:integrase
MRAGRLSLATGADEVIGRNPCRIKGAGMEPTPERPVIGVEAVLALTDAVPERYRTLILLATFGSLRWGELMGLRKSDIDLNEATVCIERSVIEIGRELVVKEPKTAAGVRTIALPRTLMREIARHLDRFAEAGPEGRMFVGPYGVTPVRGNFARTWSRAKKEVGDLVPSDLHFHARESNSHGQLGRSRSPCLQARVQAAARACEIPPMTDFRRA